MGQGRSKTLAGDLFVGATGRSGKLPAWSANNEFDDMPTESPGINLVYLTVIFRADGFRMVALNGRQGDELPIDMDGFLAYAKLLPDPVVHERIWNIALEGWLQRFIIAQSYWRK